MNEVFYWEQVPPPPTPPPPPPPPPPTPPLTPPPPYDDDDCSIFPPSRHEGLQIQEPSLGPPGPPAAEAAGDSALCRSLRSTVPLLGLAGEFAKQRLILGLKVMRSWFIHRLKYLRSCAGRAVWSFSAFGAVGALFLWWLRRRRLALARKNDENLILLVRDMDKKIDLLLHQIAQMKALSKQHQVPILRNA